MLIPCLALAGLAACAPEPPKTAAKLYRQNCVACHGTSGIGDGPLAADLPVPPADLTRISARNGGAFPKADVMAAIHGYGGSDFDRLMPSFAPVLDGPTVPWRAPDGTEIETPTALLALADYLEGLQRP